MEITSRIFERFWTSRVEDMNTDQEAAAEKIRAQMEENPYRMYANYETVGTEIEVTRVEEQRTVTPLQIDREGPLRA